MTPPAAGPIDPITRNGAAGSARSAAGSGGTPLDLRTAYLARALWSELDYVLDVDPNTLAAFCVRVLDTFDQEAA